MGMKSKLIIAMFWMLTLAFGSSPASADAGAVYTLNNSSAGNSVLMYNRFANGQLSLGGTFATGGLGSGAGLGSQGALTLDASNRFLFAVNAGSNSITVFQVTYSGLNFIETTGSAGQNPISLTSFGNLLYVLNAGGGVGGVDTLAGFTVDSHGHLTNFSKNIALSASAVGPAQVSFNPEGNLLVVTEKGTSNIDIFSLNEGGTVGSMKVIASAAETPFGFAFSKRDYLIVSDA